MRQAKRNAELLKQCWLWDCIGQSEKALRVALEIRDKAAHAGERALMAKASQYVAWFLRHLSRSSDGVEYVQESKRLSTELGDDAELARSGAVLAWLLLEFGDSEDAAIEAAEAYILAEKFDDVRLRSFVGNIRAVTLNQIGDCDAAIQVMAMALETTRSLKEPYQLAGQLIDIGFIYMCQAERCLENGDRDGMKVALQNALLANDEAIEVARTNSDFWKLRIALSNGAEIYLKRHDLAAARACLAQWELVPGEARGRLLREYNYAKCEIMIAAGEFEEAQSLCERCVELAIASGVPHQELNALRKLSELCEAKGDLTTALSSYKMYHEAYRKMAGDSVRRRIRLHELRNEIEVLKSNAQKLAAEAELDPLTNIANRRKLEREISQLRNRDIAFALALIDLDHFKAINDEYSHVVGDDVLRQVGVELRAMTSETDLSARFGGEEFALVLTQVDLASAEEVCERFRNRLLSFPWETMAPGLTVTASIGLAMSSEAADYRSLVSLADERLYAAKAAGRNRVVGLFGVHAALVN